MAIEAGGNAAVMVFEDANIDEAVTSEQTFPKFAHLNVPSKPSPLAAILFSKFIHTGQTCISPNRIFVQSSIYAEFAKRLAAGVDRIKVGDGMQEGM